MVPFKTGSRARQEQEYLAQLHPLEHTFHVHLQTLLFPLIFHTKSSSQLHSFQNLSLQTPNMNNSSSTAAHTPSVKKTVAQMVLFPSLAHVSPISLAQKVSIHTHTHMPSLLFLFFSSSAESYCPVSLSFCCKFLSLQAIS